MYIVHNIYNINIYIYLKITSKHLCEKYGNTICQSPKSTEKTTF